MGFFLCLRLVYLTRVRSRSLLVVFRQSSCQELRVIGVGLRCVVPILVVPLVVPYSFPLLLQMDLILISDSSEEDEVSGSRVVSDADQLDRDEIPDILQESIWIFWRVLNILRGIIPSLRNAVSEPPIFQDGVIQPPSPTLEQLGQWQRTLDEIRDLAAVLFCELYEVA